MSEIRRLPRDPFEDNPDYIKLRIENPSEQVATIASLTGISYRVIEYSSEEDAREDDNGTEITGATSLTVADVIYDTLQSWSIDATGYNFKMLSPATNRPNGDKWQRHQITFTPASGPAYDSITLNYVIPKN